MGALLVGAFVFAAIAGPNADAELMERSTLRTSPYSIHLAEL